LRPQIKFGWAAPTIGVVESDYVPLIKTQQAEIFPAVAEHFDSVWVFDHLAMSGVKLKRVLVDVPHHIGCADGPI
jgi:hypothetical protein